ncbi:MAG: nitrate/nitrite transporter NrtS [Pseudomonadota bacterium]
MLGGATDHGKIARRSLKVSLVVGTILVLINQGDRLLAGHAPDWVKLILTYAVPYLVSTYAAVTALRDRER